MNNHEEEFHELASQHLPRLQSYCLAKTCDADLAQDLAQEALLRAYTRFGTLRDRSKFGAWLVGIAKRCTWNWFRKKKNDPLAKQDHDFSNGPLPETVDDNPNPAEHAQNDADLQETLEAVKKLRFAYREVIILRYFEDLSYSEIAARVGISEDGVDQRLTRARRQLKKHLRHWESDR